MNRAVADFLNSWISENIHAGPYLRRGDPLIKQAAKQLMADAKRAGISRDDLEESCGALEGYVADAFERATDEEVAALAAKD